MAILYGRAISLEIRHKEWIKLKSKIRGNQGAKLFCEYFLV